jgi:hypothetical protein
MQVFEGTVRLVGDADALPAVLAVDGDRLRVSAREQEIGNWQLSDVSANLEVDGCHVVVEGEELIVSVPGLIQFAEAIGPHVTNPGNGSLRKFGQRSKEKPDAPDLQGNGSLRKFGQRPEEKPDTPDLQGNGAGGIRLATKVRAGVGAGLIVISLAIWAPLVLVGVVLLAALASLLLGAFALMDPYLAVQIPDPVTPSLLFRVGVGGVAVAILLAVIL